MSIPVEMLSTDELVREIVRRDKEIELQAIWHAECILRSLKKSAEIDRLKEVLGELRNLAVPQNGRGCLYCGTMDFEKHKTICELPMMDEALKENSDERK